MNSQVYSGVLTQVYAGVQVYSQVRDAYVVVVVLNSHVDVGVQVYSQVDRCSQVDVDAQVCSQVRTCTLWR